MQALPFNITKILNVTSDAENFLLNPFIKTGNAYLDAVILYILLMTLINQLSTIVTQFFAINWIILVSVVTFLYPFITDKIQQCLLLCYNSKLNEIIIEKVNNDKQQNRIYYAINYYLSQNNFASLRSIRLDTSCDKITYVASNNHHNLVEDLMSKNKEETRIDKFVVNVSAYHLNDYYQGDEIAKHICLKVVETDSKIRYSIRSFKYKVDYLIKFINRLVDEYDKHLKKSGK